MDTLNVSGSTNGSNDVLSHSADPAQPVSDPTSDREAHSPKPPRSDLDLVALCDVALENVKWLWPGRIAYRKLNIIAGDPGVGKSQVTLDVAARVTKGVALPSGEPVAPGNVVLLTAEDGPADTVRPRFEAAGGDPAQLHVFNAIIEPDGSKRLPRFPEDLAWLRAAIEQVDGKLVIIDPLSAYLSGSINSWNDQHVRHVLALLAQLAEETGVAVVIVMHLNKATNQGVMYRAGGSIAFVAAARSVQLVVPHPDDDDLRVLSVVKSNLAKKPSSLLYRIESHGRASRIRWGGVSPLDAETLLAEQARSGEKQLKIEDAKDFLQDVLPGARRPKEEVMAEGQKAGHTRRTLERAFSKMSGICTKDDFGGSGWWQLAPRLAKSSHTKPAAEDAETVAQPSSSEDACAAESGLSEPREEVLT